LAAISFTALAGICRDHTGIDGEAFTADQARSHALPHHMLEQPPEQVAVAEAPVPVFGERGVVGNVALETEPAEPAIGQIEVHFVAQAPLGANGEGVTDQQHADHQLGIDRGAAGGGVIRRQRAADLAEVQYGVDPAQEMVCWDMALEIEAIEQAPRLVLPSHHSAHPVAVRE